MNAGARGVSSERVLLDVFGVTHTHFSHILPAMWTRSERLARLGGHSWSGSAQRHFERLAWSLKWELPDTFEFLGQPTQAKLSLGEEFRSILARLVRDTPPSTATWGVGLSSRVEGALPGEYHWLGPRVSASVRCRARLARWDR